MTHKDRMRHIDGRSEWKVLLGGYHWPVVAFSLIAGFAASVRAGDAVSIELQGEVPAMCRLTSESATVDLGILANSGSRQISVDVDCNTPFSYVVRSLAGGLKVSDSGAPPPGFASLIPYLVQLSIPTDAGVASGECESSELIGDNPACTYVSSPTGIAIAQTGTLTLTWATQNELVAGTYSDVLTLTVQPRW